MNNKVGLFAFFILLCQINAAYAIYYGGGLQKINKNTFRHVDDTLPIRQAVTLSAHTYPDNIIHYSNNDGVINSSHLNHDEIIDLEIESAMVIRFYGAESKEYNKKIAYIIKTKGNRWFIQYQFPIITYSLMLGGIDKNQFMTLALFASGVSGPVDTSQSLLNFIPQSIPREKTVIYSWVTVELSPGSEMWNSSNSSLHFSNLHTKYKVIEYAKFVDNTY